MNQQENNEIKAQLDTMIGGLNGMVSIMEKQILAMKRNMTPEQAIEFKKQVEESKVNETLEKHKEALKDLKNELNID